jgi:hypothetical protein
MNEEFIKDLDSMAKPTWSEIFKRLKGTTVINVEFRVDVDYEFLLKYKLNENITFIVDSSDGQMNYYYKGRKMEPVHYYLRPANYTEVSTLRMLQECIKQDTNTPDIRKIENSKNDSRNEKLDNIL